ncbi:MAG: iron chelate uptake ABC transporter family permease subunit, partial [Deltaproteobacteria bacterium]|nr:iron chelate uptake ABC transporter family permease subunit [Deltaproteobacteria bacterium]
LMGDTLSHAVLPGICIAFLLTGTKALIPTMLGAMASGLFAVLLIGWIVSKSRIKSDAAMGMVLSSFFGLGIVLLTRIQKQGAGSQSGLDKFLFGQAAALNNADITALLIVTAATLVLLFLFYKELMVITFDEKFAQSMGLPVTLVQNLLMILTAVAVVASIQAVGVVLVSAMLIIPSATAYLLVKRISSMLILSVFFGLFAGFVGAFLSFLGPSLPTGPFMVVAAAFLFTLAFLFSPQRGLVFKQVRQWRRGRRVRRENVLKSIYRLLEQEKFKHPAVTLQALAAFRNETLPEVKRHISLLGRSRWVRLDMEWLSFTKEGADLAKQLVRRHRLWELFLVKEAQLPADHVHVDAEELEHILSPEVIAELEAELAPAEFDPHGKPIP